MVYPVILVRLEERNKSRTPASPHEYGVQLESVKLKIYDLLTVHSGMTILQGLNKVAAGGFSSVEGSASATPVPFPTRLPRLSSS